MYQQIETGLFEWETRECLHTGPMIYVLNASLRSSHERSYDVCNPALILLFTDSMSLAITLVIRVALNNI